MPRSAIRLTLCALVALSLPSGLAAAPPAPVRIALETSAGRIVIELAMRQAPITAGNFLRYVEGHKLDGTSFYRAARAKGAPKVGFIQGGIDHDIRRSFAPIAHEPTSKTGLRHLDGTISMARDEPGSAMGDFFITVGPAPGLDAHPAKGATKADAGFAAFGHVVSGMPVVKKILASPTYPGGNSAAMMGQMIRGQVRIVSAHRVP